MNGQPCNRAHFSEVVVFVALVVAVAVPWLVGAMTLLMSVPGMHEALTAKARR